jgi:hypothetical protein
MYIIQIAYKVISFGSRRLSYLTGKRSRRKKRLPESCEFILGKKEVE